MSIIARDEPWLRTFYMKWPAPHFYEVPKSVGLAAVVRADVDRDAPVMLKINCADEIPLSQLDTIVERGNAAPIDDVPGLKLIMGVARLPWPLCRALWTLALNVGRLRADCFGTFSISSVASRGAELVVIRAPGPTHITYGPMRPDHVMELSFHWDHRIYDGIIAARALRSLEEVLNTSIVEELLADVRQFVDAPPHAMKRRSR